MTEVLTGTDYWENMTATWDAITFPSTWGGTISLTEYTAVAPTFTETSIASTTFTELSIAEPLYTEVSIASTTYTEL